MKQKKLVKSLLYLIIVITLMLPIVSVRADSNSSSVAIDVIRIEIDKDNLENDLKYEGFKIGQYIMVNKTLYSSVGFNTTINDDRYDELIQWQSSDDSILKVVEDNENGNFIVTGYGKVTITATIGNLSNSIIVDVTRPAEELQAIKMNFKIKNGVLLKYTGEGGDVTIPDNVIEIGPSAFAKTNVTKINMSNNVRDIGSSAFKDCKKLKSIEFSDNIQNIGSYSFYSCNNLKEIKLPKKLKSLGNSAFFYCKNLSKISFPNSVETIGVLCFSATQWLENQQKKNPQVIVNGILIDASKCTGKVYISKKVKHINENAFFIEGPNIIEFKEVVIPNSVISIGDFAFSSCYYLEKITIPKSVKKIGVGCFTNTKWLQNQQEKNPLVIINGTLIDGKTSKGKVIIPKSVKRINDLAFSFANIKEVVIPSSVLSIGNSAFLYCESLEKITIPKSVKDIGSGCFNHTKWLKNQQKKNPQVIVNGILIN